MDYSFRTDRLEEKHLRCRAVQLHPTYKHHKKENKQQFDKRIQEEKQLKYDLKLHSMTGIVTGPLHQCCRYD